MSYASFLDTEAAWFAEDLPGVPALTKADGGPFDIVTPHVRRLSQVRAQLYLSHGTTRQAKGSKALVRLDHEVIAVVLMAATGAGTREHIDQASTEEAVSKVVARIIGPAGDVGHGGRWFKVGPLSVEPASPLDRLRWSDAITAAGAAHVVPIRYTVSEYAARSSWVLTTEDGNPLATEDGDQLLATAT